MTTATDHPRRSTLPLAPDLVFDVTEWGPADGPTLLALHGFPQCADSWSGLAARLAARGVRVVAFDQRGYSPGARPALDRYTLDEVVQDAIGIADRLGLRTFHLAGFGMGAVQAWQLAALLPDRVRSLAALRFPHPRAFAEAVRTDPEQRALWAELEKMSPPEPAARALLADNARGLREFLKGSGMPADVVERTVSRLDADTLPAAIAWHLIPLERFATVGEVAVPTLFLWSTGPALAPATAARCGDHVTGPFEIRELTGVGHWLLETAADQLAGPILNLLERNGTQA